MFITPEQFLIAPTAFNFNDSDTIASGTTCNTYGAAKYSGCSKCLFYGKRSSKCYLYYSDNPDLQSSVDNFRQTNPEYFI